MMYPKLAVVLGVLIVANFNLLVSSLEAHFIWVYQQDGKIQIVFGEGLEPDEAKFLAGLKDMKVFRIEDGSRSLVEFSKQEDDGQGWFEHDVQTVGQAIDVHCRYGVFGRGERKMLLDYNAKYVNLAKAKPADAGGELMLDLVPRLENGQLMLKAFFKGQPVKGVEVQVERESSFQSELMSSGDGSVPFNPAARYIVRGKYTVARSGELDGVRYDEEKYYCTLIVDHGLPHYLQSDNPSEASSTRTTALKKLNVPLADFPKGMTSFGADVVGDKIFVIGGKSGRAHAYAKSYQNRDVLTLATDGSDKAWKTVADNLGLQGLAVVGHQGKIYRIGGLEARNQEGADHDLHSVNTFTCFDPDSGQWHDLPALPSPRSSLDACVVGDQVFVLGGWTLSGDETQWADSMLRFDLNDKSATWESFEVPFRRRALAVESWKNSLVVIGGIQETGGTTNAVQIYDLEKGTWRQGPDVPCEGSIKAFGCSCVVVSGQLFVSTYDGGIYELVDGGTQWQKVHQLEDGRFFHQMVAIADNQFALVGGSHMETGSHFKIEAFEVVPASEE